MFVLQLSSLKGRLREAEVERDRLQVELEELRASQLCGVGCDSENIDDPDEMLDFPGEHGPTHQEYKVARVQQTHKGLKYPLQNKADYTVYFKHIC